MGAPSMISENLTLPFSGSTRTTRQCSRDGAVSGEERVGRQMVTLLTIYRREGALTDAEAAEKTGLMRTSIIPRRRELMTRGLVVEVGHRKNPTTGIMNTTFGLSGETTWKV